MGKFETAQYHESRIHAGNPLIEALPRQMTMRELFEKLYVGASLPENYLNMTLQERIELTEYIENIYIPMDFAVSIYASFYQGIRSAYKGRTRNSITKQLDSIAAAIEYKNYTLMPDSDTQAENFSVLGEPGMGKTETVTKILNLFPQTIEHVNYKGDEYKQIQITYLKIECPSNHSPRGVCIQILSEIDRILDCDFSDEYIRRKLNLDMLISKIAQLCVRFCVGAIIIDEIQNIMTVNSKDPLSGSKLVKFLIELSNKTGVCLICIGTPKVIPFFDSEAHLSRRTRGPRITSLAYGTAYNLVLDEMWKQQAVLKPEPLTDKCRKLIYEITGGVLSKMAKLMASAARDSIIFGLETVDESWIKQTAERYSISSKKSFLLVKEPELMYGCSTNSRTIKDREIIKEMPAHRGRPKLVREKNDLIGIYEICKEAGIPIAKKLILLGVAVEVAKA